MVKIFPVIKRVGTTFVEVPAATVTNARAALMWAFRLTSRVVATLAKPDLRVGVRVTQAPIHAVAREQPAVRVTTSASGTPRADKRVAFRFSTVLSAVPARATAALNVVRVFATGNPAAPSQTPGVRLERVTASGDPARPSQKTGTNVQRVTAAGTAAKPSQNAGARVVQTTVVLVHESGAPTVTQSNGTGWQNITNAQGKKDGTLATLQGSLTVTVNGQLNCTFADFANKTALTITKVELRFFVRSNGTAANNGDLQLSTNKGGTLEIITGDVNNLTTPRTFDITANIASWADLDALTATVFGQTNIGELNISYECDAVHVYIEANRTETL